MGLLRRGAERGALRLECLFPALCAVVLAASGCTSYYERLSDSEAYPVIEKYQKEMDNSRAKETPAGVITPKPEGPQVAAGQAAQAKGEAEIITLKQALALAFSSSRDFKFQKESLYLSALSYTSAIRAYQWHPTGTISASIEGDPKGGRETPVSSSADAILGLTRQLLTGGTFTMTEELKQTGNIEDANDSSSSTGSLSFTQPLLKGAGDAARDAYIQTQRGMLNAARGFETFRQDLVISMLTQYYGIIRQRKSIENARTRVDSANFNYERGKALFEKGKQSLVDVLQMEQDKLQAENQLSDDVEAYNLAIDQFKFTLGLASERNIDVADEKMEPEIITVNLEEAVKTALANRFDLMQARESLDDVERGLRIARNRLLPQLQFMANASVSSDPGGSFHEMSLREGGTASAGIFLQIPVDNKADRDAYRSSVISLTRQHRQYEQTVEQVKLSVRQTVRRLRQAEVTLAIQKKSVESAERQREATQIHFEQGTKTARDIVDAEKALQDAKNAYIQAQVDYMIASIQLRKDIGTLVVDENGNWH